MTTTTTTTTITAEQISKFISQVQALSDAYYERDFPRLTKPTITAMPGRRYTRIVKSDGVSRSVHCFVDMTNGNVLKAESWKKPHPLVRGNILTDNLGVNHHGAHYAYR